MNPSLGTTLKAYRIAYVIAMQERAEINSYISNNPL